jgi:hypothetical protein
MVDPEPTQPTPYSAPPYHDPWASTVPMPGPASTDPAPGEPASTNPALSEPALSQPAPGEPALNEPAPTLPMPAQPMPGPEPTALSTPGSGPSYPPATRYPYPGLPPAYPGPPVSYAGTPSSYAGLPSSYALDEPVIMQIGEIQVTATTVRTPAGTFPLQGSQWTVTDQWITEQKIPTWAIVLAIVLFFCVTVFSLLFLLAKETTYRGVVQVHVVNGPHQYVARIPAADQNQVQYLYQQVNYVRSLATM